MAFDFQEDIVYSPRTKALIYHLRQVVEKSQNYVYTLTIEIYTDNQTNGERQQVSEPTPPTIAEGEPNPSGCQELPNDGRPQPNKEANEDPQSWKVVAVRYDQSLFKVVDNAGINVADQFHSRANAEQYVAHFVCDKPPSPNQLPQEQEGCLIPEGCIDRVEICDDGIDNDTDGITDEVYLCYSSSPGQLRSEVCDDDIDNNADGFIDEGCPPSQLPQESDPTLPDFGAGELPALPETPICPFPPTVEDLESGCIPAPDRPGATIYCPIGTTQDHLCLDTDGPDSLQGTVSGDWIEALGGDDTIDVGGGSDSIRGGAGSDTIDSGAETDYITAGSRNDKVYGGYGDDMIAGNDKDDIIEGENGADFNIWCCGVREPKGERRKMIELITIHSWLALRQTEDQTK
jgi:hypothetical protein